MAFLLLHNYTDFIKIKVELNPNKQNRHQLGHKLYEDYKKKNLQKGLPIPSYTELDNNELNSFIQQRLVVDV
ncbi:hypothetical protein [Staphylococcus pseudintermedius]|uniref:hypothetical protein n=1 Tax=Staphylococcus pseudintermedius TaxID=283734 RepID=UPI00223F1DF7|nr:hypothetical protein [Staphylococcus pseudintermedius]